MDFNQFFRNIFRPEGQTRLADTFIADDLPLLKKADIVKLKSPKKYQKILLLIPALAIFLAFISMEVAIFSFILTLLYLVVVLLPGIVYGVVLTMSAEGIIYKGRLHKWEIITDAYFRIIDDENGSYILVFEVFDNQIEIPVEYMNLSTNEIGHAIACFREKRFVQ